MSGSSSSSSRLGSGKTTRFLGNVKVRGKNRRRSGRQPEAEAKAKAAAAGLFPADDPDLLSEESLLLALVEQEERKEPEKEKVDSTHVITYPMRFFIATPFPGPGFFLSLIHI